MADIAASVLAKLKNKAKASGISYQQCLQLFFQEEFLRKLSASQYAENFVLKGGLFIYTLTNFESRATVDVDFLMRGLNNDLARMDELREMLQFDGIECAHPSIPEELTPFYRQYCKDHGLLSSAGSDTHSSPDCAYQFCKESSFAKHIGEKRYLDEILERIPAFHA